MSANASSYPIEAMGKLATGFDSTTLEALDSDFDLSYCIASLGKCESIIIICDRHSECSLKYFGIFSLIQVWDSD